MKLAVVRMVGKISSTDDERNRVRSGLNLITDGAMQLSERFAKEQVRPNYISNRVKITMALPVRSDIEVSTLLQRRGIVVEVRLLEFV